MYETLYDYSELLKNTDSSADTRSTESKSQEYVFINFFLEKKAAKLVLMLIYFGNHFCDQVRINDMAYILLLVLVIWMLASLNTSSEKEKGFQ